MCLLAVALIATGFHLHRVSWIDLLLGLSFGFSIGFVLFWLGGFGGGDVKLLSALGAVLGFKGELGVLFYVAILGGVLALVARMRREKEYAYASRHRVPGHRPGHVTGVLVDREAGPQIHDRPRCIRDPRLELVAPQRHDLPDHRRRHSRAGQGDLAPG